MINFLHTFEPTSIIFQLGFVTIHWYGLFIVLGILSAYFLTSQLAKKHNISSDAIADLAFWLIIWGIIGARLYHVLLEFSYYLSHPLNIFKIWNGGIAIHGAVIAGLIYLYYFCKKNKQDIFLLTALIAPGLALAQSIGRWGNYFNQELFGIPTDKAWGIPINFFNRPDVFAKAEYFHPTFLYESFGNFLIFLILIFLYSFVKKQQKNNWYIVPTVYLLLYSILRFSLEFIRIDKTPEFLGLRWPQIASIFIVFMVLVFFLHRYLKKKKDCVSITK